MIELQLQMNLINFIRGLKHFTHVITTNTATRTPEITHTLTNEQLDNSFLFLAFMLTNMGERISKLIPKKKSAYGKASLLEDLIAIRNSFSHKLYLIEPSNYMDFIQHLQHDLDTVNLPALDSHPREVLLIKLTNSVLFLNKIIDDKIITKESNPPLFLYWANRYNTTYQKAITSQLFPESLHPICLSLTDSLQTFDDPIRYTVFPTLSLVIILGQLSLKISQQLYPRDQQKQREPRQSLDSMDQLLFDLQQIRNEVVHDWITTITPISEIRTKNQLIIVSHYLREIETSLLSTNDEYQRRSSQDDTPTLSYQFMSVRLNPIKSAPSSSTVTPEIIIDDAVERSKDVEIIDEDKDVVAIDQASSITKHRLKSKHGKRQLLTFQLFKPVLPDSTPQLIDIPIAKPRAQVSSLIKFTIS